MVRAMSSRWTAACVLAAGITVGTLADRPWHNPALLLGGYHVLAVDFHTHSSMWSDGALTPWGLVFEAERQGLDAFAMTAHNETWDADVGRRVAQAVGGPIVIVGEEIVNPRYHIIAAGITTTVSFRQPAAAAIEAVHRQGGVAIAAHPGRDFFDGFDAAAMMRLDGSELCHPSVFVPDFLRRERMQQQLERFAARAPMAAIGSSDFHGLGPMGLCRTYVFANEVSEAGILEAMRAHRTVVFGRAGRAFGEPGLVQLAHQAGDFRDREPARQPAGWLDVISRLAAILGLFILVGGERRRVAGQARGA
jgi:hypothetical protein